MQKMESQKETIVRVLDNNTPVVACLQLKPSRDTSSVVKHSFDTQNVHMRFMAFELRVMKKKKEEEEEER